MSKVKLILVVIAIGIGVGVYEFYDFYMTEVENMNKERAAAEQAIANDRNELKRLENFASNIQNIKQEYKDLSQQLELALEHMPRTFNLSALMRKMIMLAHNSGIEMTSFKPKKGEEKESAGFYSAIGIEFQLKGSFAQTVVFFDQLSRLKRIINFEAIKLSLSQPGGAPVRMTASGGSPVETQVSIKTYRFSE